MRIQDILDSTGATLVRGPRDGLVHGVSTDTRTLGPRALFLALSGPNFDGNDFALKAGSAGAGALMLRGSPDEALPPLEGVPGDVAVAVHDSPRRALADLASWHRSRLAVPVIGITGSCGKTTTKNVLAQLLEPHLSIVKSPSSFNNEIGVPHTLLLADPGTEALVVEIGTNAPGEIAALCRIARPTGGIITNVGAAHLEGLGSIDGVAREKADLFASLPADGFAVLNLDCPYASMLRAVTAARVITISVEGTGAGRGDFNAENLWFHSGGTTFTLQGREITSPLLGTHNIHNLLAAIAACSGIGIELDRLLPTITRLEGEKRRMERRELGNLTLFDDTYNANPDSARAAVRVLAGLHGKGRRVLVLGDMLELGASAPELHHKIGCDAAHAGVDLLLLVGELTQATAAGALECGLAEEAVVHLGDAEAAAQDLPQLLRGGDTVLVKGSRGMGLERLVERVAELFGEEAD